ncbi:hypothetical protein ACLOJK_001474 [Asimina triloba]
MAHFQIIAVEDKELPHVSSRLPSARRARQKASTAGSSTLILLYRIPVKGTPVYQLSRFIPAGASSYSTAKNCDSRALTPRHLPFPSSRSLSSRSAATTKSEYRRPLPNPNQQKAKNRKMPPLLLIAYALLFRLPGFLALPVLPNPDPANIQPFFPTSPPATIPAFPEQSDLAGCPLDLPSDLFPAISQACVGKGGNQLPSKAHCCPVLATWLYAAYSGTALRRAGRLPAATYDLPVLPDDSETCVENLGRAMRGRGIHLPRPNDTCDLVYCYCGIRLHVPSCTEAFQVSSSGKVVGNAWVRRLERECGGPSSLGGCNRCLRSLYQLNEGKGAKNVSATDRKNKMHSRDCELMGLTWLLAKNRTTYMSTVSSVLRATMVGQQNDGSHTRSCSVGNNGMPLAVDSAQLDTRSSSSALRSCPQLILLLASLYWICIPEWDEMHALVRERSGGDWNVRTNGKPEARTRHTPSLPSFATEKASCAEALQSLELLLSALLRARARARGRRSDGMGIQRRWQTPDSTRIYFMDASTHADCGVVLIITMSPSFHVKIASAHIKGAFSSCREKEIQAASTFPSLLDIILIDLLMGFEPDQPISSSNQFGV